MDASYHFIFREIWWGLAAGTPRRLQQRVFPGCKATDGSVHRRQ